MRITNYILLAACLYCTALTLNAKDFVIKRGIPLKVLLDKNEMPVVHSALNFFKNDYHSVFGDSCVLERDGAQLIVGTKGVCRELSGVADELDEFNGKSQSYIIKVSPDGRLVIAGSDAHGTAYGLMELSRLIGVSPWEWWADCEPDTLRSFKLSSGYRLMRFPSVEYRGIFINDEDWGLMPWSYKTYEKGSPKGHIGANTHERIFELLLRLRANTFWPAMHECTHPFFMTERNREVAKKFGIYLGSSHCEPMASSAAVEWGLRGKGEYDYVNNATNVYNFWSDRIKEVAGQEMIYTIGMRGVHDGRMQGAKTIDEQKDVLTRVFKDQRSILSRYVNKDVTKVPQVFIPYKEVLDVYNAGLQVPDDVTLMWCDDNYGYIRHFPSEIERSRIGGNGVYYHISYWGRPHDYLWLCTVNPALIHQQMSLAYDKGIQKMWILNVGDIKPCEYQTELFLDMAWDIEAVNEMGVERHLRNFLSREFGDHIAGDLTRVMAEHYRFAYIRKPEFMGNTRVEERDLQYKVVKDLEWSEDYIRHRLVSYKKLSDEVEQLESRIPLHRKTAYYHLVKYPVQAAAQMNIKHLSAQLARHGKANWNLSHAAHDSIIVLTRIYNDEKWAEMMDCRPRRLPVFAKVREEAVTVPLKPDHAPILTIHAADAPMDDSLKCPLLGYDGKAARIPVGSSLVYEFKAALPDSILIELAFLPTHPVHDDLRVKVFLDGKYLGTVSYRTQGRSEEWKQNVLRNQALCRVTAFPTKKRKHILEIHALDEGVVLDRICLTDF